MINKKNILITIILILVIIGSVFLVYNTFIKNKNIKENKKALQENSNQFKKDYELLNGTKDDKGNLKYIDISLPETNPFKYATINEVLELLKNGTGILYIGMPECNWCRNMLPILIEAANETKTDTILYYNPKQIRTDNTSEYQEIVSLLNPYLSTDTTTQKETDTNFDKNKKRVYMPDVYIIKNGKILGNHAVTLDSQKDSKIALNESQHQELKTIYKDLMLKLSNSNVCEDDGC